MAKIPSDKPGRPVERKLADMSKHSESSTSDGITRPAEPNLPRTAPASVLEGAPNTTAASGELPAAAPTVTQASPDLPETEKLVPELAGSDLQPVEGRDPQGRGTHEPTAHAKPKVP
jgi:hypothetical protein